MKYERLFKNFSAVSKEKMTGKIRDITDFFLSFLKRKSISMNTTYNLKRFVDAQERDYATALSEIKNGKKRSHWMWYIFPQIDGLGFSETAKYYAIKNEEEATSYLEHPVLGKRLIQISEELCKLQNSNATYIFGTPDDLKLKSCMTLFSFLSNTNPVFDAVLNKFFNGKRDAKTVQILGKN